MKIALALGLNLLVFGGMFGVAAEPESSGLFPQPENAKTGYLRVSDVHEIFFIECGNPQGKPVMCLHGGPGVGSYPRLAQYFDPQKFRILLHDQRGTGQSRPFGELRDNTTWDLVDDIEKLRIHFGLEKFLIFGGSWGSTLGLAYAETHPERVEGLILRGVFLGTPEEIEFHYVKTGWFFPEEYHRLCALLPHPEKGAYPQQWVPLIYGDDAALSARVSEALARFELKFMTLNMPDETIDRIFASMPKEAMAKGAAIDHHYVIHDYFLKEHPLLDHIDVLKDLPVTLINGRYDMAAPPRAAFLVHQALPQSELILVEGAGHSEREPGITAALLEAVKKFE